MRVGLLGGTGLLGHHSAHALCRAGHDVLVVSRTAPGPDSGLPAGIRTRQLDLVHAGAQDLASLLTGLDCIVYLLGPDDRSLHPAPAGRFLQRMLVEVSERVTTAAARAGVRRVVVAGSYFTAWNRERPELHLTDRHPYIRARSEQARRCIDAGARAGADVCVLEIPWVFGNYPHGSSVFASLLFDPVRRLRMAADIPGGTSVVTAAQVGQAVLAAAERGRHGARYPVTSADLTYREIIGLVADGLGRTVIRVPVPGALVRPWPPLLKLAVRATGRDTGLDYAHVAHDVVLQHVYVDAIAARAHLGYPTQGVREAITESVRQRHRIDHPGVDHRPS
ncbi:MAG: hypothetical protein CSB46_00410 [Micrococcales bacterium]|nr:MAG: hypothetical protein CSB46_00410 [Micrococcales bacterium]